MNYYKISITSPPDKKDILIALLSQYAFNGFEEEAFGIKTYIEETAYNEALVRQLADQYDFCYKAKLIPAQNWNEIWESTFKPIKINNFCAIRADFHPTFEKVKHQITINPKMAFGTGHHETTLSVMEMMQHLNFKNKKVLDYGCGTGILAILANKLGATDILAIDNDPLAYENTLENRAKNGINGIKVALGDLSVVEEEGFDFILANINRNVILNSLPALFLKTQQGGQVLISGFLKSDESLLTTSVKKIGFSIEQVLQKEEWICMRLQVQ